MDVSVASDVSEANRSHDTPSTSLWLEYRLDQHPVVRVPVSALATADSPRLAGENPDHVWVLAESDVTLPPIIVHRSTMRVIDGAHRLRAAVLRGAADIEVRFFDGDEADAFIVAVRENIMHGLPLTLADRKAAAQRIIESHPQWSDRVIGAATGLAANTVRTTRRCLTAQDAQLNTRVGRDGKARPLNTEEGRLRASAMMTDDPNVSLREVAKAAGISPATARDVRERLRRGEDPVPGKQRLASAGADQPTRDKSSGRRGNQNAATLATCPQVILQNLKKDPSIRFSETGRALLRLLDVHAIDTREWTRLVENIPAHCTGKIADLARRCAWTWMNVADQIERNQRSTQ